MTQYLHLINHNSLHKINGLLFSQNLRYLKSTLSRCSLTTVAQSTPNHEKPFYQGLLQPQGVLYPIQAIIKHRSQDQLLEFRTSFHKTVRSKFLVQGNFQHTQFGREDWTWRDSNSQSHAPKARAVTIELFWRLTYLWIKIISIHTRRFSLG